MKIAGGWPGDEAQLSSIGRMVPCPENLGTWCSEDDDRAVVGRLAAGQCCERPRAAQREGSDQVRARQSQHMAVVPGAGDEKDRPRTAVVAPLERLSPRERLNVVESRLRVEGQPPTGSRNHRVPRASIAGQANWHLGAPCDAEREECPEPREERDLSLVPDGVSSREDTERKVETEYGGDDGKPLERDTGRGATLDSTDLRDRDAGCLGHRALREAGREARFPQLVAGSGQRPPRLAASSIEPSFADCHDERMTGGDAPSVNSPFAGHYSRGDERRAAGGFSRGDRTRQAVGSRDVDLSRCVAW